MRILQYLDIDADIAEVHPLWYTKIVWGKNKLPKQDTPEREIYDLAKQVIRSVNSFQRTPCFICGQYHNITECHHIISVEDLAHIILRNYLYCNTSNSMKSIPISVTYLCPTHHRIVDEMDRQMVKMIDSSRKWNSESNKFPFITDISKADEYPQCQYMDKRERKRFLQIQDLKKLASDILPKHCGTNDKEHIQKYGHIIEAAIYTREGLLQELKVQYTIMEIPDKLLP